MALVSAQSKSSEHTFTMSTDDLKIIIANVIVWLVMHLIHLLSQFYLVCLPRLYFLNLNLYHTLLIFAQQMVP